MELLNASLAAFSYSSTVANLTLCLLVWLWQRSWSFLPYTLVVLGYDLYLLVNDLWGFFSGFLGELPVLHGFLFFSLVMLLFGTMNLGGFFLLKGLIQDYPKPARLVFHALLNPLPFVLYLAELFRFALGWYDDQIQVVEIRLVFLVTTILALDALGQFWVHRKQDGGKARKRARGLVVALIAGFIPIAAFNAVTYSAGQVSTLFLEHGFSFFANSLSALFLGAIVLKAGSLKSLETGVNLNAEKLEVLGISAREREVIELIRSGLKNDEMAESLGIEPGTVKNHIFKIYQKTGAQSRVQLLNLLS